MITIDDFEVFCRRSLASALRTADELGEELINTTPQLTGGTSPYALITHLLGAATWWIDHIILGHESDRDRDGEFVAAGSVASLHEATNEWLTLLADRRPRLVAATRLAIEPAPQMPLDGDWTVGAALLHIYEEIAQHLGHLELTADIVRAEARVPSADQST